MLRIAGGFNTAVRLRCGEHAAAYTAIRADGSSSLRHASVRCPQGSCALRRFAFTKCLPKQQPVAHRADVLACIHQIEIPVAVLHVAVEHCALDAVALDDEALVHAAAWVAEDQGLR